VGKRPSNRAQRPFSDIVNNRMESEKAKAYVDRLYQQVYEHWDRQINRGPFMSQLRAGTLPLPCLRRFFKDWGLFSIEVVALNAVSYYIHLPFFVSNYDLLPAFADKIAEELVVPKPPGHILILLETANALGLSKEAMFEEPASAAGRAISDYTRRVFQDGSIIELWGAHVYEETLGHWAQQWAKALTSHYGMSERQAVYFSAHAEADLVQHAEHMGHGPLNRMILQRILERGLTAKKLGYDPKYCAFTMVDLQSLMERHALENPYTS
jgi:pyrroloquinoline quinone (PQQ) biosynthesis protein C